MAVYQLGPNEGIICIITTNSTTKYRMERDHTLKLAHCGKNHDRGAMKPSMQSGACYQCRQNEGESDYLILQSITMYND